MTTIEYLDRELRRVELSMRRAAKKPNTPQEELRGLQEKRANLCEARAAVLEMRARPEAGKPLTLEQLVELGVKAESGENHIVYCTPLNDWCKVFKYGLMFFGIGDYRSWREIGDTYGKEWLAYAYPPVRIDREKWEPCSECGANALIMGDKYCCECGRPLTEEAWAELERRVCGG